MIPAKSLGRLTMTCDIYILPCILTYLAFVDLICFRFYYVLLSLLVFKSNFIIIVVFILFLNLFYYYCRDKSTQ